MPYILGGFLVFLLLAVLGGPLMGIGLLALFFIVGLVFLVSSVFAKGKAPSKETTRTLEKRAVQRLVELMGFTWIGTASSEMVEHERRALSLLGLMSPDGVGSQAHFEDVMVLPDSAADLKIFDLTIHSSSDVRENVAAHWFRGLVLSFELPRSVEGLVLGQGQRRGASRLAVPGIKPDRPVSPVTLESERFNRAFNVQASDQVMARYLLTPAFMERLADSQVIHRPNAMDFCLFEGRFLLALDLRRECFEFGTGATLLDPQGTLGIIQEVADLRNFAGLMALDARTRV
jgi:hypothetical protein